MGHSTILSLRGPARGFADDLALVTRLEADMSRLLQVVADFCVWSWMRIKGAKTVATCFDFKNCDFKNCVALSTEGILYAGAPLTGLAQAGSG